MRIKTLCAWLACALTCALPGALAIALPRAASAEVYRWTDAQGHLHFTQRLDQVPAAYRAQAERNANARAEQPSPIQTYSSTSAPASNRSSRSILRRDGEILVPFVRRGSLMQVNVRLNDQVTAPFFVDTGASGVSMPSYLVSRLGLRVGAENPRIRVSTANGIVSRAIIRLDSVQLGEARVEDLEATVNPSMEIGLLGGSFFNNFIYRVDAAEGVIAMRVNEGIRGGLGQAEWRSRFREIRVPLGRLETYLSAREVTRPGRRQELEQRRGALRSALDQLESEANHHDVPQGWRR